MRHSDEDGGLHGPCRLPAWALDRWSRVGEPTFVVAFRLCEGTCVYRELYEEFAVESFEEAVERLFASDIDGLFVQYAVYVPGVGDRMAVRVDWPLLRRGRQPPASQRGRFFEDEFVNETECDGDPVLVLYRAPRSVYGPRGIWKLCVAGEDSESAIANWEYFAKPLRRVWRQKRKSKGRRR